jgi:hypothetical protein
MSDITKWHLAPPRLTVSLTPRHPEIVGIEDS